MKIKLSEKTVRGIIKPTFVNEIVDLATGVTDFETPKFEKCEQINIPPIIKDWLLNKWFDQNPEEVRANLKTHFSNPGLAFPGSQDWNNKSPREQAQIVNSVFSDESIKNISYLLNQFTNISGIPAVFCKFLQMAIDELAKLMGLFVDFEKKEEGDVKDISAFINLHLKNSIEKGILELQNTNSSSIINAKETELKMTAASNRSYGGTENYLAWNILHWISGFFKLYSGAPDLKSPLKSLNGLSTPTDLQSQDKELVNVIKESYKTFVAFQREVIALRNGIDENTKTDEIFDGIKDLHEEFFFSGIYSSSLKSVDPSTIGVSNCIDAFRDELRTQEERIEKEHNLLQDNEKERKKKAIVTSYFVMMKYMFSLGLQEIIIFIPATHGEPNFKKYYQNYPQFVAYLTSVASQILK
jgi:hypothetical protein